MHAQRPGASFSGSHVTAPVGSPVDDRSAPRPVHCILEGKYGRLRPIEPARDAERLYRLSHGETRQALWAYLSSGPFATPSDFEGHVASIAASTTDTVYWAIADATDAAVGWLSLMRIEPRHRVIEVGNILYTPLLQRTRLATEAQFLIARHVFEDLGYRRFEWKCNDLNAPSRRAAVRFGFSYEGRFRQHMIIKGRNRDTAWYAMLDHEWPECKANYERWLAPGNFDENGRQRTKLNPILS